jgi:mono/diheme cytochrome c family protein
MMKFRLVSNALVGLAMLLSAATQTVSSPNRPSSFHPRLLFTAGGGREASRISLTAPAEDGAYSSMQAERGKAVYEQSCTSCHGPSLRGGANEFAAPALAGPFFFEKWTGRPLEAFFRYATENMPPEGRLSPDAYLDVIAYILQVWKYPSGSTDLNADSPAMKRPIQPNP